MLNIKKLLLILSMIFGLNTHLMSATITVNTLVDENVTNGKCSLREAIVAANTNIGGDCNMGSAGIDIIDIDVIGTITIVSTLPTIVDSVKIIGKGTDKLIIQGPGYYSVPAYDPSELQGIFIFRGISSPSIYELKGMSLRDGRNVNSMLTSLTGGAVSIKGDVDFTLDHVHISHSKSDESGGGLSFAVYLNNSKLKILSSTFFWNEATDGGGGLYVKGDADVIIKNSTFQRNDGGYPSLDYPVGLGGGIFMATYSNNGGSLLIENSTLVHNQAHGAKGGAIFLNNGNSYSGTKNYPFDVNISHSTIVDNGVAGGNIPNIAPPPNCTGQGGGIYVGDVGITLHLDHTILYGNKDIDYYRLPCYGRDIYMNQGGPFNGISGGQNWIGNVVALANTNNVFQVTGAPNAQGDYVEQGDPGLKPIDYYGGFTKTMPPLDTSSPVVIYAKPCNMIMDQRGFARFSYCHIGAAQLGGYPISDYDGDWTYDEYDAFPLDPDEQIDTDGDGIGNNADTDDDGDGVSDTNEFINGTNHLMKDTDSDGVNDGEDAFPLDASESIDTDGDDIGNNADTDDDGDGISDAYELTLGFDPLDASSTPADVDNDGIPNALDTDNDNDGISDADELANGLDPLNAADGIADFDGDGFSNALEITVGTNFNLASSKPIWTPIIMGDIMIFVPTAP